MMEPALFVSISMFVSFLHFLSLNYSELLLLANVLHVCNVSDLVVSNTGPIVLSK